MKAEFTERHFEKFFEPFLWQSHRAITPSEFIEKRLGIDGMLLTFNQNFWSIFGRQRIGVMVTRDLWEGVEHDLNKINFPELFHANLFIQYKRPDYLRTKNGEEYNSWNTPYYRYKINENQNKSLSILENNLGNGGLVTYACPAASKNEELRRFAEQDTLIENTNFVNPSLLIDHETYTFVFGGTEGIAFSSPKKIKSKEIEETIKKLRDTSNHNKNIKEFFKKTASIIENTVEESEQGIKTGYFDFMRIFTKSKNKDMDDLEVDFAKIFSYTLVMDLSWKII